MRPLELLVLYLLVGGVGAAAAARAGRPHPLFAWLLWPLAAPTLFTAGPPPPDPAPTSRVDAAVGRLADALDDAAPASREALRAAERGLRALESRLVELDRVLASLEAEPAPEGPAAADLVAARAGHVARLRGLRDDARDRLDRGLARLAELTSRAHVARFTGEEADAVADALGRLAAAVDSAAEVARVG